MNRNDWLILLAGITLIGLLYRNFWFAGQHSQMVQVQSEISGTRLEPLSPNRILHIHGKLGNSVLEIKDHAIRFVESPCINKTCIHGGWLNDTSSVLACLPNRVSVQLMGPDARFDAINF